MLVRKNTDISGSECIRKLGVRRQLVDDLRKLILVLQSNARGQTRDLDIDLAKFCNRLRKLLLRERLRSRRKDILTESADFDPVIPEIFCHGVDIGPGIVRTAEG